MLDAMESIIATAAAHGLLQDLNIACNVSACNMSLSAGSVAQHRGCYTGSDSCINFAQICGHI